MKTVERVASNLDEAVPAHERQVESVDSTDKEARRKRVAEIKRDVEAGTYRVDPLEVSKRIIDRHLAKSKPSR